MRSALRWGDGDAAQAAALLDEARAALQALGMPAHVACAEQLAREWAPPPLAPRFRSAVPVAAGSSSPDRPASPPDARCIHVAASSWACAGYHAVPFQLEHVAGGAQVRGPGIGGLQATGGRVSIEAVEEAFFLDRWVARAVTGCFRASADAGRPSLERHLRDGIAPAPTPEDRLRACLVAREFGGLSWKGPAPPLARLPSADHLRAEAPLPGPVAASPLRLSSRQATRRTPARSAGARSAPGGTASAPRPPSLCGVNGRSARLTGRAQAVTLASR